MSIGTRAIAVALCVLSCGCGITGHNYDPSQAGDVVPVTLYSGHVLGVQTAAIGSPDGAIGVYLGPSPTPGLVGVGFASGNVSGTGALAITALGAGLNVGAIGGTAPGLEYTIAVDQTRQIVQVAQYPWPEDYASGTLQAGQPVVIRVVGTKGHVLPLAAVPPADRWRIDVGEIPLPLGGPYLANLVAPPLVCGNSMPGEIIYCDDPHRVR